MPISGISNISIDATGKVTASIDGKQQPISPEYLMMMVLAQKRRIITSQLLNQINQMSQTNRQADNYNALIAKIRQVMPSDKDGKVWNSQMDTQVINPIKQETGWDPSKDFDVLSYSKDSNYTYDKLNDMLDDLRNKVTSLNNLNSENQLKIKETQMYRDETTEWQNSAMDKLGRVFEKVNS